MAEVREFTSKMANAAEPSSSLTPVPIHGIKIADYSIGGESGNIQIPSGTYFHGLSSSTTATVTADDVSNGYFDMEFPISKSEIAKAHLNIVMVQCTQFVCRYPLGPAVTMYIDSIDIYTKTPNTNNSYTETLLMTIDATALTNDRFEGYKIAFAPVSSPANTETLLTFRWRLKPAATVNMKFYIRAECAITGNCTLTN